MQAVEAAKRAVQRRRPELRVAAKVLLAGILPGVQVSDDALGEMLSRAENPFTAAQFGTVQTLAMDIWTNLDTLDKCRTAEQLQELLKGNVEKRRVHQLLNEA